MRALLITGLSICVLFVFSVSARTCESLDIRNNVTEFEKLRNCTVIAGYLQIVLLDNIGKDDFENISFAELREITGFLLFFRIRGLQSIGKLFPNLSVIRGLELFNDYALIIYEMSDLEEVGLHSLSAIQRGSVRIEKNLKLCYVHTVNWTRLIGDAYMSVIALNHNEAQCPACPKVCENSTKACWNNEHCQTEIAAHCHRECVKGCDGPGNDQCHACKNLRDENRCVSQCSANKFVLSDLAVCVTKDECHKHNGTWWTFNRECIDTCPAGYERYDPKEGDITCMHCGADCPKVCEAAQVDSISAAQKIKGCTHINGSLSIRIEGPKNIEDELEKNLGMIQEIYGYLRIYRSFSLKSLNFLKSLKVIHGNKLENGYSVIVIDNQNLQSLWNWTNLNLEIKNGTFNFHYNPKLCLTEIEKLRTVSRLKLNYTIDKDVSTHSNGDKFSCNYVNISTKVNLTGPNEIILTWMAYSVPDSQSLIGYLIYYREAPTRNFSAYDGDACGDKGWRTIFHSADNDTKIYSQNIKPLQSFTQYAYYVSFALSTGKGGHSPLKYFKTLSSDPDNPEDIEAFPAGSDSLFLTWKLPKKINGILSNYVISAYLLEDDKSFIDLRNYCEYPLQEIKHKPAVKQVTTTPAPVNTTKCCKTEPPVTVIQINEFQSICSTLEKLGNEQNSCSDFSYQLLPSAPYRKYGGSSANNMIIQKRQETTIKPNPKDDITVEVNGNETSYKLSGLKHFSIYILFVKACNQNRTEKAQCSPVVMLSQRTGRKSGADDIRSVKLTTDFNSVGVQWPEPENPNAVIVSYKVEYRRTERESYKYISHCITRSDHENSSYKYTMRLPPGDYTLRIRAQSLAGDGNYTENFDFIIPVPGSSSTMLNIIISVLVIVSIIIAVAVFYFWWRRKHMLDNIHLFTTCNPDYVGYIEDGWEMERDNIKILQELGQGTFGMVYSGLIKDRQIPCAIKTVHEKADLHDKMEFLNEASIMKTFNEAHHVVRLLGVVSRGTRPLVIMELMARGDLKTFLRSTRDSSTSLTCSEMYRMAAEIADGMAYLSAKKFVHRDLAARNCMVSSDHTVKIGDFGMTRDIYETDYYRKETRGLLPVRWMAPESLADGVFSVESDVWSYGIVLWEIATLAEQPYQGLANEQVLQFVINKGILERPLQCPDLLYDIMEVCWKWRPHLRPLFTDIVEKLESNVGQDFKLVSFYHSREGEEFRMMKRELKKSETDQNLKPMPVFSSRNITAHWTKDGNESNCYLGSSSKSVAPSSYHSSTEFMHYPLSSS